jgi:hypothetical protein
LILTSLLTLLLKIDHLETTIPEEEEGVAITNTVMMLEARIAIPMHLATVAGIHIEIVTVTTGAKTAALGVVAPIETEIGMVGDEMMTRGELDCKTGRGICTVDEPTNANIFRDSRAC